MGPSGVPGEPSALPGEGRNRWLDALAARTAATVVALPLLIWSVIILSNIWGYNDSGALAYIVFACVPGVPGLVLLLYAALPRHCRRTCGASGSAIRWSAGSATGGSAAAPPGDGGAP